MAIWPEGGGEWSFAWRQPNALRLTPESTPGSTLVPEAMGAIHNDPPTGLRSGELARLAGVSTDTLRHYERAGVLPLPRRQSNGYRAYSPEAVERVRVIQAALGVGFTLEELRDLFASRESGRPPCRKARDLVAAKLEMAETQLAELERWIATVRALVASWDAKLLDAEPGKALRLLEELSSERSPRRQVLARRRITKEVR